MTTDNLPPKNHQDDYERDTLTNDRLLKDHEYDGIKELDNGIPSWFRLLFLVTIAFAFFYLYSLWVFKPDSLVQQKEFEKEMFKPQIVERVITPAEPFQILLLHDDASLASGGETFRKICAACHLTDGGGLVGPNLTDNFWIHGNTIEDLYRITTEGIIEKGMIPYRDQLSDKQRLEVCSYILVSLVGSTPAKAKEPQGERYD